MSNPSSPSPKRDPLPPFCREVLQLYGEALADVRFPDLDLGTLEASAERARAAQLALERVEAKLEVARAHLQEQLAVLSASAARALAYAQVFAQTDPKLQARVDQVGGAATHAPSAEPRAKRRARRDKAEHDASLFATQTTAVGESETENETETESAA
jgi:hypothetical protein